jgi:hypothetical protein
MASDATGWKRSAALMAMMMTGMSNLASQAVSRGLRGLPFDDESLAEIKANSVLHLKNMGVTGIKVEDEAELLREAIEGFDKLADGAIAQGRQISGM